MAIGTPGRSEVVNFMLFNLCEGNLEVDNLTFKVLKKLFKVTKLVIDGNFRGNVLRVFFLSLSFIYIYIYIYI